MIDNVYLIEKFELELWDLVERKHNLGLTYWEILRILIDAIQKVFIKSSAEYLSKGGK